MNKITTIVADDEPAARESVRILLSQKADIEILAICKDGKETAEAIINLRPHLVFLDIQMPCMDGFEVLEAIDYMPAFVFVTAFDQYAIKAFEKSAVDYLLKPYDDERFYKSLEKAKQAIQTQNVQTQLQRVENLLTSFQTTSPIAYKKKLISKNNGQITLVPVETIFNIESEGNFVKIHTQQGIKLGNYTFKQLEQILDPSQFVRIHKSNIVNIHWIEMMESHFHGDYIITLKNGVKLKLSRNYKESLDHIINNV
ncbi:MAG TPA: LytTR family DNA-binding domain-containing protein [Cyclobacteriaceae bacterium]